MLKEYGSYLEGLQGKIIPEHEMGVINNMSQNTESAFIPNNSQGIEEVFRSVDQLYAAIRDHLKNGSGKGNLKVIGERYEQEIKQLLNT